MEEEEILCPTCDASVQEVLSVIDDSVEIKPPNPLPQVWLCSPCGHQVSHAWSVAFYEWRRRIIRQIHPGLSLDLDDEGLGPEERQLLSEITLGLFSGGNIVENPRFTNQFLLTVLARARNNGEEPRRATRNSRPISRSPQTDENGTTSNPGGLHVVPVVSTPHPTKENPKPIYRVNPKSRRGRAIVRRKRGKDT